MLNIDAMLILRDIDFPKQYRLVYATLACNDGKLVWSRLPNLPVYSALDKQIRPHLYKIGPWIDLSYICFRDKKNRYPFSWKTYFEALQLD